MSLKVLKPHGLVLRIASLKEGLHEFSDTFPAEALELAGDDFSDLSLSLKLDLKVGQALVSFQVTGIAHLICDRTLQAFDQTVSGAFQVLYSDKAVTMPEHERGEDLWPFPHSTLVLSLTEPVRDTLLLALPIRRVAPNAEEQDIQLSFGGPNDKDEPSDLRWAALRGLNLSTDN